MTLDPNGTIAGLPARRLRELLRHDAFGELERSVAGFLEVSKAEARRVLARLVEAGLVERRGDAYALTQAGAQTRAASLAKRIGRKTADTVLAEALARIEAVDEDDRYGWRIREAFVFGSYLTDAETLDDLDLALGRRVEGDEAHHQKLRSRVKAAREEGCHFGSLMDTIGWASQEVWLAVKNRSRSLSLHEASELEKLGTPYVRIYPQIESETIAQRVAQAR